MSARIDGIDPDSVVVDAAGELVLAGNVQCAVPECTRWSSIGWRIDAEPWQWLCPRHRSRRR